MEWKKENNLQFVIIKKASLEFIGCSGLHNIGESDPELGVWIKKNEHGNKYGLEAITSMINWAKSNIQFEYYVTLSIGETMRVEEFQNRIGVL